MNLWWLSDLPRLELERQAIEELSRRVDWLRGIVWTLDGARMCCDVDMEAKSATYPVRLRYPDFFPASPPAVIPRDVDDDRWSFHQYGRGGELCLEWGPDNWHRGVTGADMLESAHRLLETENPLGAGSRDEAPSRHEVTLGQRLRRKTARFALTSHARDYLSSMSGGEQARLRVVLQAVSLVSVVEQIGDPESGGFVDPVLPPGMKSIGRRWDAVVVKADVAKHEIAGKSLSEILQHIEGAGGDVAVLDSDKDLDCLILVGGGDIQLLWIVNRTKGEVILFETVALDVENTEERQLLELVDSVKSKRVGIVGLGSAGSKIAVSLGRAGVRDFLLVDDDIFQPENMVRHTLDWRSVLEHKADGVALQLQLLGANMEVRVERVRLAGQEATVRIADVLRQLSECDLVIDATACPRTFAQLAHVASESDTAMIWLEVYAGGIGGLVARFRPGHDPDPLTMRQRALDWMADQVQAPPADPQAAYGSFGADRQPVVASDADVSVVAAHATRFAIDMLTVREPSAFPYSMYLVGLAQDWVFDAPFHTIPIDVGDPVEGVEDQKAEVSDRTYEFLHGLIDQARG